MHKQELLRLYDQEMRVEMNYPNVRREETEHIVRHVSLSDEPGTVLFSRMSEANAEELIAREIEYFSSLQQSFEWKLFDYDQPANLLERLEAHGFTTGEEEALLVMDVAQAEDMRSRSIPPEIRQITNSAGIDDIMQLEEQVWGSANPEMAARLKKDLAEDPKHLLVYAAYSGDQAVSAAWMYLHEGTSFGSLWGGSTLPAYRNKGYYTALVAIRVQVAHERGYPLLMVDASPMSRPILEKKGFEFLAYTYPCFFEYK
ncbi:GNAT family N-acetyltransferase [Brevibacillus sp. HB1.1]|uniref:GNAT family N-acetyltransferase n=1 Tax=Brevibacillus sp. HB1.1 TaxID=2738808 RepID=UPI00157768A0|nr:GNAT family N-acetyltransferase [Brevibacillus sp. HB1.1]NTU31893.1 GNAT family N-acetyltransferase [Brevibacillus sp. HB1.1]